LKNPGLAGDVQFDTVIYGSPPLAIALLSQFAIYNAPDPAYVTGRINVSAFANIGGGATWPFLNTNVPLNGHVCIPAAGALSHSRYLRTAITTQPKTPRQDTCILPIDGVAWDHRSND